MTITASCPGGPASGKMRATLNVAPEDRPPERRSSLWNLRHRFNHQYCPGLQIKKIAPEDRPPERKSHLG